MNSNHGNPSDDRSTTATTSAVESMKAGRGWGQRGGRGRGHQAGWTPTPYNRPSFIGQEPTLKHDIFDYQEMQQAQKYRDNIEALKTHKIHCGTRQLFRYINSRYTGRTGRADRNISHSGGIEEMGIGLQEKRRTMRDIPQLPSQFLRTDLGSMYPCITRQITVACHLP